MMTKTIYSMTMTILMLLAFLGVPPDLHAGDIQTDGALISTAPNGKAPLEVDSSTRVDKLNVDFLDGLDAGAFALDGHLHPELDPPAQATVAVDCDAGGSVNQALKTPADQLVIEISGLCEELIVIRRNHVTLRGTDPALDGIRPPAGASGYFALLEIRHSLPVALENLSVSGSASHGIETFSSDVVVENCRIENHAAMGVRPSSASYVVVTDSVISGNGTWGARARSGGTLWLERTDLSGNTDIGFGGVLGAYVVAIDVSVDGSTYPVWIFESAGYLAQVTMTGATDGVISTSSYVSIFDSTLGGSASALRISSNGRMDIVGSTLEASLVVQGRALVYLSDSTQTAVTVPGSTTGNFVESASLVHLVDTSTLLGPTYVLNLGRFTVGPPSVVDGDLICTTGTDAFCDDASNVTGLSNCEHCPPPSTATSSFERGIPGAEHALGGPPAGADGAADQDCISRLRDDRSRAGQPTPDDLRACWVRSNLQGR